MDIASHHVFHGDSRFVRFIAFRKKYNAHSHFMTKNLIERDFSSLFAIPQSEARSRTGLASHDKAGCNDALSSEVMMSRALES